MTVSVCLKRVRPLFSAVQDCRAVKEIVEDTFDKDDGPSALIIYVGQKPE